MSDAAITYITENFNLDKATATAILNAYKDQEEVRRFEQPPTTPGTRAGGTPTPEPTPPGEQERPPARKVDPWWFAIGAWNFITDPFWITLMATPIGGYLAGKGLAISGTGLPARSMLPPKAGGMAVNEIIAARKEPTVARAFRLWYAEKRPKGLRPSIETIRTGELAGTQQLNAPLTERARTLSQRTFARTPRTTVRPPRAFPPESAFVAPELQRGPPAGTPAAPQITPRTPAETFAAQQRAQQLRQRGIIPPKGVSPVVPGGRQAAGVVRVGAKVVRTGAELAAGLIIPATIAQAAYEYMQANPNSTVAEAARQLGPDPPTELLEPIIREAARNLTNPPKTSAEQLQRTNALLTELRKNAAAIGQAFFGGRPIQTSAFLRTFFSRFAPATPRLTPPEEEAGFGFE